MYILYININTLFSYNDYSNANNIFNNPITQRSSAQLGGGSSQDHNDTYVPLQLTYIIDPNDMIEYDQYGFKSTAAGSAWYLRQSVKFDISLIDDPGPGGYGKQ